MTNLLRSCHLGHHAMFVTRKGLPEGDSAKTKLIYWLLKKECELFQSYFGWHEDYIALLRTKALALFLPMQMDAL